MRSRLAKGLPDGAVRSEAHAKAAIEYLHMAVDRGFNDRVHLRLPQGL